MGRIEGGDFSPDFDQAMKNHDYPQDSIFITLLETHVHKAADTSSKDHKEIYIGFHVKDNIENLVLREHFWFGPHVYGLF